MHRVAEKKRTVGRVFVWWEMYNCAELPGVLDDDVRGAMWQIEGALQIQQQVSANAINPLPSVMCTLLRQYALSLSHWVCTGRLQYAGFRVGGLTITARSALPTTLLSLSTMHT